MTPCSFPIGPRDRTDRTSRWDEGSKVRVDLVDLSRMSSATRHLADRGRPFHRFEGVGKLFCPRDGVSAGQKVHRLAQIPLPRNIGQGPHLLGAVAGPPVETVEMDWLGIEEITTDQSNHCRLPTVIFAQINDKYARIGQEDHRGDGYVSRKLGVEGAHIEIANIARQALHFLKPEVLERPALLPPLRRWFFRIRACWQLFGRMKEVKMGILADLLQMAGQLVCKNLSSCDRLVFPALEALVVRCVYRREQLWEKHSSRVCCSEGPQSLLGA